MKQSRRMSFAESCANVAIGYGINLGAQMAIFPLFGIRVTFAQNVQIGIAFTVISIARSYAVRRLFERWRA